MKVKYVIVDEVPTSCINCPFIRRKVNVCRLNKKKFGVSKQTCPLITEKDYNDGAVECI